jgi:hypothetical protein
MYIIVQEHAVATKMMEPPPTPLPSTLSGYWKFDKLEQRFRNIIPGAVYCYAHPVNIRNLLPYMDTNGMNSFYVPMGPSYLPYGVY